MLFKTITETCNPKKILSVKQAFIYVYVDQSL